MSRLPIGFTFPSDKEQLLLHRLQRLMRFWRWRWLIAKISHVGRRSLGELLNFDKSFIEAFAKIACFGGSLLQDCVCVRDGEEPCWSGSYSAGCFRRICPGRSLCLNWHGGAIVQAALGDYKKAHFLSMFCQILKKLLIWSKILKVKWRS